MASMSFSIPCGTPGLKFLCRDSFDLGRSHFDHPLGSRFEEMDCIVFFDDVLVPWERVFLLYDVERLNATPHVTHSTAHSAHQGAAKNLAKCEFVLGLALLMSQTLGNSHLPHTEERIGELMLYTELMRSCLRDGEADAEIDRWGVMTPAILPTRHLMRPRSRLNFPVLTFPLSLPAMANSCWQLNTLQPRFSASNMRSTTASPSMPKTSRCCAIRSCAWPPRPPSSASAAPASRTASRR